jgi:secondary thiamine-phosphate synthase enzyme
MIFQDLIEYRTSGRGSYLLTDAVRQCVRRSGISTGLCHLFLEHTSASLVLCENADPDVRVDMERFMVRLVPDGDPLFIHVAEGPDDMPAHIRTLLTHSDITLPVADMNCALGTWQGIYLWEHRSRGHRRRVRITVLGE